MVLGIAAGVDLSPAGQLILFLPLPSRREGADRILRAPQQRRPAPFDFRIEPRRQFRAHVHHRQANFGAVDQSAARQPVFCRRRARLGEQQSRQFGNPFQHACAPSRSPCFRASAPRRTLRSPDAPTAGWRRRRRRSAPRDRCASSPVSTRKPDGLPAQELDRLRAVGAAILDADDVRMFGESQQRLVGEVDRGPIGDVVEHERPRGVIGERFEMLHEAALRGPRCNRGSRSGSRRSARPRSHPALQHLRGRGA